MVQRTPTVTTGISCAISGAAFDSDIDLYINSSFVTSGDLYIRAPDYDSNLNLTMNPQYTNQATLYIKGNEFEASGIPLFIGENLNDNLSLFIMNMSGSIPSSPNLSWEDQFATVFIKGTDYYSNTDNVNLFLKTSSLGSNSGIMPLYLNNPGDGEGGGILSFKNTNLVIYGSGAVPEDDGMSLYIPSELVSSGTIPIFIRNPTTEIMPLYIESFISSGNMNVYISGNNTYNDNINLLIKAPESNNFKIFFRGYVE